ncbi:MAG: 1-acyl-sn-glycerol-3-phosphate acyltransferase [Clostridiales bacterium]|jgi:1-acyl-sn-glycerol-3-phosphate acyltransferase|nr:1-acyl-sn-glycerol-3-phosphate acyltransferase [Clostridiales bacterium]
MKTIYKLYYAILYPIIWLLFAIKPINRENVPEGPALVCANHSSYLDIPLLSFAFGIKHYLRYVAKKELLEIPVFGWLIKKAGTIGIGRGKADISAIKEIMRALKEGYKVAIFPEGTRVRDDSAAAKTGAIMIAAKTGVPLIPVNISRKKRLFRKTTIIIGQPYRLERIKGGTEAYESYASDLMSRINNLRNEK